MTIRELIQYVVPVLVVSIVLAIRFRNMRRARPLDLRRIWLVPALLVVVAGITLATHPPGILGLGLCFLALIVGGAIGWHRGRMMRIEVDPATGKLSQTASPAAMLLLAAIIAVRYAARAYFQADPVAGALDERTLVMTDVLLAFAVGLLSATRIEMAIRAKRILASAREG